jgi:hypothetical protein
MFYLKGFSSRNCSRVYVVCHFYFLPLFIIMISLNVLNIVLFADDPAMYIKY